MKTTNKFASHALTRAWSVSIFFLLWFFLVIFFFKINPESLSLSIFYLLLIINTFFSIRTFATITPKDHFGQKIWDILLILCLVSLPLVFSSTIDFVSIALVLFVVASLKYIFLIPVVNFSRLLFYKIRIDTLGILLCTLCLLGVIGGFPRASTDIWTSIFFLANVYVLWYEPLYRVEHHFEGFL